MGRLTTSNYVKWRKGADGSKYPVYDRDVPEDIRHIVGKAKWKKSLRGLSLDEVHAEARRLASEHDQIIAVARRGSPLGKAHPIGVPAIALAGGMDGLAEWIDNRAREAVRLGDEAASWREHASERGPDDDIPDPDWAAARAAALEAERLQINRQIARDAPHLQALGQTPANLRRAKLFAAADAMEANPSDPETITLSGVVAAYKRKKSPENPNQYEYPVKLFEELHGALPIKEITKHHVREFRDAFERMPPASGGKFDGLTMQQIIQKADAENLPRLKYSTLDTRFRCVKAVFAFAVTEGYIDNDPAYKITIEKPKGSFVEEQQVKRRTFSPAEMVTLFDAAENRNWRDRVENMWFLRLLTYTGARPEELAQLAAVDVVTIGGRKCLSLHDAGANRVKNLASIRKVPIHPELVRLGFLDFAKAAGNRPYLFTSLEPDGKKRRYGRMRGRLTLLIDGKVSDDPRLVPYSLRHGFKDAMRLAGAPEEVVEQIMGHKNPEHRTGRGYGEAQVAVMTEWMAKADPFDKRRDVSEFVDDEDDGIDEG